MGIYFRKEKHQPDGKFSRMFSVDQLAITSSYCVSREKLLRKILGEHMFLFCALGKPQNASTVKASFEYIRILVVIHKPTRYDEHRDGNFEKEMNSSD